MKRSQFAIAYFLGGGAIIVASVILFLWYALLNGQTYAQQWASLIFLIMIGSIFMAVGHGIKHEG